jgi:hypothetical protein
MTKATQWILREYGLKKTWEDRKKNEIREDFNKFWKKLRRLFKKWDKWNKDDSTSCERGFEQRYGKSQKN